MVGKAVLVAMVGNAVLVLEMAFCGLGAALAFVTLWWEFAFEEALDLGGGIFFSALTVGFSSAFLVASKRLAGQRVSHPWVAVGALAAGLSCLLLLVVYAGGTEVSLITLGFAGIVMHHLPWIIRRAPRSS